MAATNIRSRQIKDADIIRDDVNTTTSGSALITKAVSGTGVSLSSTGIDAGTGDVTIALASGVVTAGTYNQVTVDTYGRVTSGTTVSSGSGYTVASVSTTPYTETATSGTKVLLVTASSAITINLPTAVGNTATYIIKKVSGANSVTIDANSTQTIDGGLTAVLNKVYESITLVSDNSNWQII